MTATLNASTSTGVVLTSDTSGNLDIQSNGVSKLSVTASGVTFTNASTAVPCFSAGANAGTTLTNGAQTKIAFAVSVFDTNSNYSTVNSRFTPTVAGYYQINACSTWTATGGSNWISIYKNGVEYQRGNRIVVANALSVTINTVMYFNGSTDYIEIWGFTNGGSVSTATTSIDNYFNGCYLRST